MKAWILEEPRKLVLQQSDPTETTEAQIKVKIEQVLLTATDYEIYTGANKHKYPFIIGRYAVGVVSKVGSPDNTFFQKMDRVAIEPYIPCETCDECKAGNFAQCSDMKELGYNCNGVMQNFIDLPYAQLHRLPERLPNETALFVPYVAFCLNILDALKLDKGKHIAIFASTKTGLILAQLVSYYQAVPIFISNQESLLSTAADLGIYYRLNPDQNDVEKEIKSITSGRMCNELVLFANSDFNMKDVYSVASMNASICLAGYSNKESKLSVAQICKKHLKVFGVYNGAGNFSSAINLLITNTVNVEAMKGSSFEFELLDSKLQKFTAEDFVLTSHIVTIN